MNYLKRDEGNHTQNHILKKLKNIGILLLYKIGRKLRYIYIIILIMLYKHIQVRTISNKDNINIFYLKKIRDAILSNMTNSDRLQRQATV